MICLIHRYTAGFLLLVSTVISPFSNINGQEKAVLAATTGTPVIDGDITEAEWTLNGPFIFMQMQPFKGKPAREPVWIGVQYDLDAFYLVLVCRDPEPEKIVSNIAVRDNITGADDFVLVQLDTDQDRRTAYVMVVNPLGTQADAVVSDDGKVSDIQWDTEWHAATSVSDTGWVAEMAIPFKSIRYKKDLDTWGINFVRMHRSLSEISTWSGPVNHYYQVSSEGSVTGLDLAGTSNSFFVLPYATLRYEDSDLSGKHHAWIPDAGIDARWQFTKSSVANLTVNPDFATVEGDQEQINLTRWELQFPEKRQFFLEANDMYLTGIRTFYSRRIGDIHGGAKAIGKEGKYAYSVIGLYSERDSARDDPPAFYTIARVKRDVLRSSSVGLTFTDKSHNRGSARTFSADYILNLGKDWKLSGQVVGSSPGNFYDHTHFQYSYTGNDLMSTVNQTGFVREDDMQEFDGDFNYTLWLNQTIFKYIFFASYNNIFWNYNYSYLRSWYFTQRIKVYLKNRFSVDASYSNEFKLYDKKYYNHRYELELGYNTDEWSSVEAGYYWGRNYDRDFRLITGEGRVRLWRKFAVSYALNHLTFEPDPGDNSTWINILSMDYYFKRDLWIRVFAQNNTNIERVYFYGLFGWRFRPPFSAVYLIYTADDYLPPESGGKVRSDIFFIKVSYQIGQ